MEKKLFEPRTTRSGRTFSCIANWGPVQTVVCPTSFDLAPLLKKAVESDHDCDGCAETFDDAGPVLDPGLPRPLHRDGAGKRSLACDLDARPTGGAVKKIKRSHLHRREQRNRRIRQEGHKAMAPPKALYHVVEEAAQVPVEMDVKLEELPACAGGYRAKSQRSKARDVHDLEHYRSLGYTVLKNDGSKTFPIVDSHTHGIFAIAVGKPKNDPTFDSSFANAFHAMEGVQQTGAFNFSETHHQRGNFPVINTGITRGPGSDAPTNVNTGPHSKAVQDLLNDVHIRRIATYTSAAFSVWAPRLFQYYKERLDPLLEKEKNLKRNFEKSIFTSAAFNFGPSVCTISHRDCMNCPFGWCGIQSLGDFDHTKGGHLVLEDLKLLIEFPPGCLILIPSAVLTHSNTPIQPGEKRASFTQYCAGALFRYVDNGFMTQEMLQASVSKEEFEAKMKEKETRWREGLALFSTVDELLEDLKRAVDQEACEVEEGQL